MLKESHLLGEVYHMQVSFKQNWSLQTANYPHNPSLSPIVQMTLVRDPWPLQIEWIQKGQIVDERQEAWAAAFWDTVVNNEVVFEIFWYDVIMLS